MLRYAAVQTEQSIRLGYWMDWNDPDMLRWLGDKLGEDPAQVITVHGPSGPVTDTVEQIVGRLGLPELGGSLLHVLRREQLHDLGLPQEVLGAGLALQGARCDALVPALRHRPQPARDRHRGLQELTHPSVTLRFPLRDRPGESPCWSGRPRPGR